MSSEQFFAFTAVFRRFLFSLSLEQDGQLRAWMLDDPEPFNRLLLMKKVGFSSLTEREMEKLGSDKSVFVRRRFFYAQLDAGMAPARSDLISLALDPHKILREIGQFYLKEIYKEDAYSIYHTQCGEAFFYIADYARKEDNEHFFEGVISGSRATKYNCLRAVVSQTPERIRELDLVGLLGASRRFRAVLIPVLPRVLSLDEILSLRSAITGSSARGIISFLRLVEAKSFWTFVDEGLSVLLSTPSPELCEEIVQSISGRVSIPQAPTAECRESITAKLIELRNDPRMSYEEFARLLEFTMKSA